MQTSLSHFILGLEEEEAVIVGTAESSGDGTSSKLIDGLGLDGRWHSNGCARSRWFSFELEVPQKITRVKIVNQRNCQDSNNIRITIGPSKDYDPSEPQCLPEIPQLKCEGVFNDFWCTGALHEGKFVKISRRHGMQMSLCEVKIFTALSSGN